MNAMSTSQCPGVFAAVAGASATDTCDLAIRKARVT
jgi:hypothetical protein